tara:strand:- start:119 stop:304 length:186 start_codon:yes stop_codon:yes gene_type:complete
MYVGGKTERVIGKVLEKNPDMRSTFKIATKANPWFDGTTSKTTPQVPPLHSGMWRLSLKIP